MNKQKIDILKSIIDSFYEKYKVKIWLAEKIDRRISYIYGKGEGFKIPAVKTYEDDKYVVFIESDKKEVIKESREFIGSLLKGESN